MHACMYSCFCVHAACTHKRAKETERKNSVPRKGQNHQAKRLSANSKMKTEATMVSTTEIVRARGDVAEGISSASTSDTAKAVTMTSPKKTCVTACWQNRCAASRARARVVPNAALCAAFCASISSAAHLAFSYSFARRKV